MRKFIILMIIGMSYIGCVVAEGDTATPIQFMRDQQFNSYLMMPETLVYRIQQGDKGYVIYDVRDAKSFNEFHIKGSINLTWETMDFQKRIESFPRDKDIIIVSTAGDIGLSAVQLLLEHDYVNVYSIEGGFNNWPYKKMLVKR